MAKERIILQSIGHAITRICPITGTQLREIFPDREINKDTKLEAKRSIITHEGKKGIFIEVRVIEEPTK
jgi:hypothetical protein